MRMDNPTAVNIKQKLRTIVQLTARTQDKHSTNRYKYAHHTKRVIIIHMHTYVTNKLALQPHAG